MSKKLFALLLVLLLAGTVDGFVLRGKGDSTPITINRDIAISTFSIAGTVYPDYTHTSYVFELLERDGKDVVIEVTRIIPTDPVKTELLDCSGIFGKANPSAAEGETITCDLDNATLAWHGEADVDEVLQYKILSVDETSGQVDFSVRLSRGVITGDSVSVDRELVLAAKGDPIGFTEEIILNAELQTLPQIRELTPLEVARIRTKKKIAEKAKDVVNADRKGKRRTTDVSMPPQEVVVNSCVNKKFAEVTGFDKLLYSWTVASWDNDTYKVDEDGSYKTEASPDVTINSCVGNFRGHFCDAAQWGIQLVKQVGLSKYLVQDLVRNADPAVVTKLKSETNQRKDGITLQELYRVTKKSITIEDDVTGKSKLYLNGSIGRAPNTEGWLNIQSITTALLDIEEAGEKEMRLFFEGLGPEQSRHMILFPKDTLDKLLTSDTTIFLGKNPLKGLLNTVLEPVNAAPESYVLTFEEFKALELGFIACLRGINPQCSTPIGSHTVSFTKLEARGMHQFLIKNKIDVTTIGTTKISSEWIDKKYVVLLENNPEVLNESDWVQARIKDQAVDTVDYFDNQVGEYEKNNRIMYAQTGHTIEQARQFTTNHIFLMQDGVSGDFQKDFSAEYNDAFTTYFRNMQADFFPALGQVNADLSKWTFQQYESFDRSTEEFVKPLKSLAYEAGSYAVRISGKVSVNGRTEISFADIVNNLADVRLEGDNIVIQFARNQNLKERDDYLGTAFARNPLFFMPFDGTLGEQDGTREGYGISFSGLQENIILKSDLGDALSARVDTLFRGTGGLKNMQAALAEDYKDVKDGKILEIDFKNNTLVFSPSIPVEMELAWNPVRCSENGLSFYYGLSRTVSNNEVFLTPEEYGTDLFGEWKRRAKMVTAVIDPGAYTTQVVDIVDVGILQNNQATAVCGNWKRPIYSAAYQTDIGLDADCVVDHTARIAGKTTLFLNKGTNFTYICATPNPGIVKNKGYTSRGYGITDITVNNGIATVTWNRGNRDPFPLKDLAKVQAPAVDAADISQGTFVYSEATLSTEWIQKLGGEDAPAIIYNNNPDGEFFGATVLANPRFALLRREEGTHTEYGLDHCENECFSVVKRDIPFADSIKFTDPTPATANTEYRIAIHSAEDGEDIWEDRDWDVTGLFSLPAAVINFVPTEFSQTAVLNYLILDPKKRFGNFDRPERLEINGGKLFGGGGNVIKVTETDQSIHQLLIEHGLNGKTACISLEGSTPENPKLELRWKESLVR